MFCFGLGELIAAALIGFGFGCALGMLTADILEGRK